MIFCADRKFERFEDITPELLNREKVKLLLCDLDNTLRLHSEKSPTDELGHWIENCKKAKVQIVIISNNARKKVIRSFCQLIDVPCISRANKPLRTKLTKTMKKYHLEPLDTVMLGDKWSTDVLAAKFAGVRAWKVKHRKDII